MHILKQSELDGPPCPDTLIHGECLESMKHIADSSVDMILADLPYGTTDCAFDTVIPFAPLWEAYNRVIKPNGIIVLTASQPFTTDLINSNRKMFRYCLVWDKVNRSTGALNANRMPMKRHEDIVVFYKKLPTYNPQWQNRMPVSGGPLKSFGEFVQSTKATRGKRISSNPGAHPVSVISIPAASGKSLHPTGKPVPLFEYLIKTYTNPGDLVLDNCMGSGTLPVACLNTGRHFIGIEQNDEYFAAGCARVRARETELALTLPY